jgi:hypothetical protein
VIIKFDLETKAMSIDEVVFVKAVEAMDFMIGTMK